MVTIIRVINPYIDHDKVLTSQEVSSMENLTKHLLRVPTLKSGNVQEFAEFFAIISTCRKGGRGTRGSMHIL